MTVEKILKAKDNTGKIAIRLDDGSIIESVLLIDQTDRVTACISCQVGCAQGCQFCQTATLGLKRDLSTNEIVKQVDLLQEVFHRDITNVVYMGMGEPLHNIENVIRSIRELTNPKTYNIFLRRITVSTSGAIKGLPALIETEPYPGLAFSLITADQTLRTRLMPGTPKLDLIKASLMEYQQVAKKRIIIEVITFDGINESIEEAEAISDYLKGLDVIINLIPYNSIGDSAFKEPNPTRVKQFSEFLFSLGLKVTIRHSKGQEIAGACGQLGSL